MYKINLFSIILLVSLFIGCDKLTSPIETRLELNSFPTQEGSYWIYEVTDSIQNIYDTLKVSILDNTILSNGKAVKIWEYRYSENVDTLFVAIEEDTISFYQGTITSFAEKLKIIFPLFDNKNWDTRVGEANVGPNEYLCLPSTRNYYTYRITIYPTHFMNSAGIDQYFISPGIGIIKYIDSMWTTLNPASYHYTVWELINYHIN